MEIVVAILSSIRPWASILSLYFFLFFLILSYWTMKVIGSHSHNNFVGTTLIGHFAQTNLYEVVLFIFFPSRQLLHPMLKKYHVTPSHFIPFIPLSIYQVLSNTLCLWELESITKPWTLFYHGITILRVNLFFFSPFIFYVGIHISCVVPSFISSDHIHTGNRFIYACVGMLLRTWLESVWIQEHYTLVSTIFLSHIYITTPWNFRSRVSESVFIDKYILKEFNLLATFYLKNIFLFLFFENLDMVTVEVLIKIDSGKYMQRNLNDCIM